MSRPAGMPRAEYRALLRAARWWFGPLVDVGLCDDGTAYASRYERHDEGYHSEGLLLWVEGGVIHYQCDTRSRDCDGSYSSRDEGQLRPMRTRPGRYVSRAKVTGLREPRSVFRVVREHASQRDHSAEAMGY